MENLAEQDAAADTLASMRSQLTALADQWDDEAHSMGKTFWGKREDLRGMVDG